MNIFFFNEGTKFKLKEEEKTAAWINAIIEKAGSSTLGINYIFCSDQHLLGINEQYLSHDTLTDIITFDHSEEDGIEADIFISTERVQENASALNKDFDDELHRVIIHGILHLLGYSDKTKEQKQEMREKEDACLSLR